MVAVPLKLGALPGDLSIIRNVNTVLYRLSVMKLRHYAESYDPVMLKGGMLHTLIITIDCEILK